MNPSGMRGSASVTSFCLRGDLCTVCFPFIFVVVVDGPAS
jgi:hypothetical protein